jgi:tetratricopeptide (TPR) repeat protein
VSTRGYSVGEISRILELPASQIRSLAEAGLLSGETLSFRDLVLLRTAKRLAEKRISKPRIHKALTKLKAQLAGEVTGVDLAAHGREIVARRGTARWHVETGQRLLEFDDAQPPAPVSNLRPLRIDWYARGCELEETDPAGAKQAYLRAIHAEPEHVDAHLNLGRLLHEGGQLRVAEHHYRRALEVRPGDATALFNLAVALEDQGRDAEAIEVYAEALERDPELADAHFNLARLHEKRGEHAAAIRRLRDYRKYFKR